MVAKGWNKLTDQAGIIRPALELRSGSGGVIPAKPQGQNGEKDKPAKEDWGSVCPRVGVIGSLQGGPQ